MTQNLFKSLVSPVVTEKSTKLNAAGKYTFFVSPDTNKKAIKLAFQKVYGVDVKSVNIVKSVSKQRAGRNRKLITKRPVRTKAIITLKENKPLDLSSIK